MDFIQYVILCDWLPSLSTMLSSFIYIVAWINTSLLLLFNNIPLYGHTTCLPIHQLMDMWIFPIFGYYGQCSYEHACTSFCVVMCSFLLGRYLGIEFLSQMITASLTFLITSKLFSKVVAPFCILTDKVLEFQFLRILTNYYGLNVLVPPTFIAKTLTPSVTIFGDGACEEVKG